MGSWLDVFRIIERFEIRLQRLTRQRVPSTTTALFSGIPLRPTARRKRRLEKLMMRATAYIVLADPTKNLPEHAIDLYLIQTA